jgi:hypothetical protein
VRSVKVELLVRETSGRGKRRELKERRRVQKQKRSSTEELEVG